MIKCKYCTKKIPLYPKRIYCSKDCYTQSQKGKPAWNKGLPAPWARNHPTGFKKGSIPWNKGKICPSISAGLMGHVGLYKGEKRPEWVAEKIRQNRKYRNHSEETKAKIKLNAVRGDEHPRWRGGKTTVIKQIRDSIRNSHWRWSVFKRDNYKCVECLSSRNLQVDHIVPLSAILNQIRQEFGDKLLFKKAMENDLLWDINNGRTLCVPCHKQTDTYGVKAMNYQLTN